MTTDYKVFDPDPPKTDPFPLGCSVILAQESRQLGVVRRVLRDGSLLVRVGSPPYHRTYCVRPEEALRV